MCSIQLLKAHQEVESPKPFQLSSASVISAILTENPQTSNVSSLRGML